MLYEPNSLFDQDLSLLAHLRNTLRFARLDQEPVFKGLDLRQIRDGIRIDHEVGKSRSQGKIERSNQEAGGQIVRHQKRTPKRDALSCDGGVDREP